MLSKLLIPMSLFNLSNLTFFKGFMSMSVSCHFVLQCLSLSFPLLTWSLGKRYLIYMRLLRPWHTGWFVRSIEDLSSPNNFNFLGSIILSFSSNISINVAWHIAYDAATYSIMHDDKVTMFFFLELHEIEAPSIMNI